MASAENTCPFSLRHFISSMRKSSACVHLGKPIFEKSPVAGRTIILTPEGSISPVAVTNVMSNEERSSVLKDAQPANIESIPVTREVAN